MNKQNEPGRITASKVTMPSGGGAQRSISEPFKAQSFTGAGGFSVPFPLPDARGLSPSINLSYSSSSGNGLFGLGFSVALESIVRKTSNGIPRYDGTDVFILGDSGELLPKYTASEDGWEKSEYTYLYNDTTWNIVAYRPRVEGDFSLIEHWTDASTLLSHWKVISSDNITSLYGISDNGRIYNPQNPEQIFEWLIETSYDAHGNKIIYTYKPGDRIGIPESINNKERDYTSQRYPDSIYYGNYFTTGNGQQQEHFAFEIVFNYGQLDKDNPNAAPTAWIARPDIFSSYRSGFEIRTARLCSGIYLRHNFPDEENGNTFTTALLPEYDTTSVSGMSIISRITSRGYRIEPDGSLWIADASVTTLNYHEFDPLTANWQLLEADAPGYLNSTGFVPVDLDGTGIDGLLYTCDSFTGYLEPLGNGKYAPMRVLEEFPVFRDLKSGQTSLTSLDGNNVHDLVVSDGITNGFFEHTGYSSWNKFQPFINFPQEYLSPEKEMVDLSGTGRSDLLLYDNGQLKHYASEGKTGFADASYSFTPQHFPITAQQSEEELSGFSDFIGDGLSHRFCLRNGSFRVWPCLGHGNFGFPVAFSNAPFIEGLLDASRLYLIDADGSGATDIVYCYAGYARIWFNRNGNSFSDPIDIPFPGTYSRIASVTAGDVSGYGTTAIIFTVTDPELKHFYYDLSNRQKPYLLQTVDNGTGGLSSLTYTTSVLEQLRDKQEGRIWPTKLPIAVSVVSESRVSDQVTGAVYTQRYRYHDGYFDPTERVFRGFGYVEAWDCETYEAFRTSAAHRPQLAELMAQNLWMPPVYTRSWFITGAYEQTPTICRQYESEYFNGDAQQWSIRAIELDTVIIRENAHTLQQAYASLAGQTIRTEVYAEDNSPLAQYPYTVSMSTIQVRLVQPMLHERYCSVMPIQSNELNYTYDRNPADPFINQNIALATDEYGHLLLSAAISFPRRNVAGVVIYPEQQQLRVIVNRTEYINTINNDQQNPDNYWQYIGIDWQNRSYEVCNLAYSADAPFTQQNLLQQVHTAINNAAGNTDYTPDEPWSNLLSWSRNVYWNDEETALAYGVINELALLHHSEVAVLTPGEVTRSYGYKVSDDMLTDNCGYVLCDNYWWNYGQMQLYNWNITQFYTPSGTKATIAGLLSSSVLNDNGFNGCSAVEYDAYYLNIISTSSALSDTIALEELYTYDYQAMAPIRSTDANQNILEVVYDPLQQVIATTVYGQIEGKDVGDLPIATYNIIRDATFDDIIANPARYLQGATTYFYYDLHAWRNRQQPVNAISITRNLHVHELEAAGTNTNDTLMPVSITYSNGTGTVLQTKAKTTPGNIVLRNVDGTIVNPSTDNITVQDRWLVSGRTVYNNKQLPVAQYQPYFSATPDFEDQQEIIDLKLVPPPTVIHYDPAGRVIRTDAPKGFFSKTVYTSWETIVYDFNDTIADAPYYQWFMSNYPENPELWQEEELNALQAALPCYNTPAKTVVDNLGNPIRTIACNLGAIGADTIPIEIADPMTPQQAWNALLNAGYIAKQNTEDENAWVSSLFQPYTPGFHQSFLQQFPDNGVQLEDYLSQSCMTTLGVYNIQGQQLYNTDPRLFLKMVREETALFNFRSEYGMGGQLLKSESADAGTRCALANIAGNNVYAWDSRCIRTQSYYDNLQRPLGMHVSNSDGTLDNRVQLIIYGESVANAADYNLMGKIWKDYEESGFSVIETYGLSGAILKGKTYLRPDYKTDANWTTQAQQDILNTIPYNRATIYNANGQAIAETLPDGSQNAYTYDINGRLLTGSQKTANPASAVTPGWETIISNIEYDATNKRTKLAYGNGVTTSYTYDALTQQVVHTYTTRNVETDEQNRVLQDIYYIYEPMGHTVATIDRGAEIIYNKNQKVAARSTYIYDPLYRIIEAHGRTLPSLNKIQQENNQNNNFILSAKGHISDLQNQVNYTEHFTYDFGDNMILKRLVTDGGGHTQVMTVKDTNNHLDVMFVGNSANPPASLPQFQYDGNGNMLTLTPGSTAQVNWNYMNQVANVVNIAREVTNPQTGEKETLNDAEYYQYNTTGNRVRKVTERVVNGGAQIQYTEKIYLGDYRRIRTWTAAGSMAQEDDIVLQSEKNMLVLNDGKSPVLIAHVWVVVPPYQSEITSGDIQYRYQLCDPTDSVTIELNDSAEVLTFEQYYVYGGTSFTLARSQLEAVSKELRFCGKERDNTTGLYYYGARYYAAWLCRWISPDPAGPVDGPNLYEYVGSNPVNYNDPSGMGRSPKIVNKNPQKTNESKPRKKTKSLGMGIKAVRAIRTIPKRITKKWLKSQSSYVNDLINAAHGSKFSFLKNVHSAKLLTGTKRIAVPKTRMSQERLVVRHLSTALLSEDSGMVEVQAAIDTASKHIYVASNKKDDDLFKRIKGTKLKDLQIKNSSDYPERVQRHIKELGKDAAIEKFGEYTLIPVKGLSEQHAETKILKYLTEKGGNFTYIGGVRRPCACCFIFFKIKNVDQSKYNPHHGAYWDSQAATLSLGVDADEIKNVEIDNHHYYNVGATKTEELAYDTDSDNEDEYLL